MRVMHVIPSMGFGGAEMLLATQIPFFCSEGVELEVVTVWGAAPLLDGAQAKHTPLGLELPRGPLQAAPAMLRFRARLRKHIDRARPDIVHLHLFMSDAWGRLAAAGLAPTVTSWHSTDEWLVRPRLTDRLRRQLERWTSRRDDAHFIAVSHAAREHYCKALQVSPDRVHVIHNGVDLDRFVKEPPVRRNTPSRIAMVGRFHPAKGHDTAVRALDRLARSGVEFCADFLGDGPLRTETERLAEACGLGRRVRFLGVQKNVPQILPQYDVLMMPSRYEGFAIAAVEAMASFVPVIASNTSGLNEVCRDNHTALLTPVNDPDAVASALHRLLSDEELRTFLAKNARASVEESYSLAKQTPKIVNVYRSMLANAVH